MKKGKRRVANRDLRLKIKYNERRKMRSFVKMGIFVKERKGTRRRKINNG